MPAVPWRAGAQHRGPQSSVLRRGAAAAGGARGRAGERGQQPAGEACWSGRERLVRQGERWSGRERLAACSTRADRSPCAACSTRGERFPNHVVGMQHLCGATHASAHRRAALPGHLTPSSPPLCLPHRCGTPSTRSTRRSESGALSCSCSAGGICVCTWDGAVPPQPVGLVARGESRGCRCSRSAGRRLIDGVC